MSNIEIQDNDILETKSVLDKKLTQAKSQFTNYASKGIQRNEEAKATIANMTIKELAKNFGLPTDLQTLESYVMHKDGAFVNHLAKQTLINKLLLEKGKK